ncbi:hypothetical protein KA017_03145, partial [Candidatus Woesebacteria bacterium]|nr:hypothetical protein [Candidatus Woesebacteria bacterium]
MNQENGPVFEPTLPEGVTYKDLNDAHDADMKDGGDREEKMYPTPVAQIDNSRAYSNLMTQAKTRDLLEGLRRELQPNEGNPDEKSNFDMRTGDDELTRASIEKRMNKREEFFKKQDDQLNELLDLISRTKNVAQVAEKLRWAEDDARDEKISGEGLNNIREVAAQRTLDLTTELHAHNFNELLDLIS